MKTIVISQPMYFPWVGMFEQLRLADVYVDYSDVAFSKGSFTNRVQIKTQTGVQWLTLPLNAIKLGQNIADITLDERQNWRKKHRSSLAQSYARAPFAKEMLGLVDEVLAIESTSLADIANTSMRVVHRYFNLDHPREFHRSADLAIGGASTDRVLAIVKHFEGTRYITGHGAKNYLDHALFDSQGVAVEYMEYDKREYSQLHPPFTPFVSILDLIANTGQKGLQYIASGTRPWREVILPTK
jgi:hypothetical protein